MSITYQVLGEAGRDNALLVHVNSGQSIDRLLFNCGDVGLALLPLAEVKAIDHLFFSHLHMDHIGGFDTFFRTTYDRTEKVNNLWGPPETRAILHCRFRGFRWNLYHEHQATWYVHDISEEMICTSRYELAEAFTLAHDEGCMSCTGPVLETPTFSVISIRLDHLIPSLGYLVREQPHRNIDMTRLRTLGLPPGPWLKTLKDPAAAEETLDIAGTSYATAELRRELLVTTPGEAIAYVTDYLLDEAAMARLIPFLHDCRTLVCESQYLTRDQEKARGNYHLTATGAAELARAAGVEQLILFHISDRYTPEERCELLYEARAIFPATNFPTHWPALLADDC